MIYVPLGAAHHHLLLVPPLRSLRCDVRPQLSPGRFRLPSERQSGRLLTSARRAHPRQRPRRRLPWHPPHHQASPPAPHGCIKLQRNAKPPIGGLTASVLWKVLHSLLDPFRRHVEGLEFLVHHWPIQRSHLIEHELPRFPAEEIHPRRC